MSGLSGMTEPDPAADCELIDRVLTGDSQAFEKLVLKYQRPLIYFTRRFLDEDAAEDVVQSTWLKVYLNLKTLRSKERFRTWIYQIARNMVVSHMRKNGRVIYGDNFDHIEDPSQDIPMEVIRRHEAQSVHAALDRLKPEFCEVLTLQFMEDMSYEEIAQVCKCSIGTVKSRIYYAKKALMQELEGTL